MGRTMYLSAMSIIQHIRQLYIPVQPTIRQTMQQVTYAELLPHEKLQPYIYCYWELKTSEPLQEPFTYRVVADGCIDIFFDLHDPAENFVMGFCKKYTEFPLENNFHYAGIRFLPTMFPQIFKIDASFISNKAQELAHVVPDTSSFIKNSFDTRSDIKTILDDYFIALFEKVTFDTDARLYEAIDIILKNAGVLNIQKDLDTGISERQLRRLFQFYIGDSAKTFAKVVRFQNILRAKPSSQSLRQNKLFFDAGYFDQAHFIKEFKNFYGVTPSKAFGR